MSAETADLSALPPLLANPERRWRAPGIVERTGTAIAAALRAHATVGRAKRLVPMLAAVERLRSELRAISDTALRTVARDAGAALRADAGQSLDSVARVLAPVCEAASRVLGQRPHDPQLLAAYGCVRGLMVEMATGEGKTLAASVAAATLALSGTPVHVLTVNRYLAERDATFARPLHAFFGLNCGLVTEAVPPDARRAAYRCPIVVAVNKDIAFDYMRDRLALSGAPGNARRKVATLRGAGVARPLLRGLHHAIVDEADSVLIDEARTPLILAAASEDRRLVEVFDRALAMADRLLPGVHYALAESERRAVLLPAGRAALATLCAEDTAEAAPWDVAAEREDLIEQGLTARHLLIRDEHYLVSDGAVRIVDEFTGRVLPDRTWTEGLHELVERKECLPLSPRHTTEARMTYQRFARRYRRLSGLSGTLNEVAGELWRVYGVRVARVPTHRPDRKTIRPTAGFLDDAAKWRAIRDRVAAAHDAGAPVLIGTRTLAASARAAAVLAEAGLPHVVLNAAQDAAEAEIVAAAGQRGAITVATNMAGRGTDIRVSDAVAEAGGLLAIVSEPHEARRIDRQLIGRCGRQGQPGEAMVLVSLDDALLARHGRPIERFFARILARSTHGGSIVWATRRAQFRSERLHAAMRRDLLRSDDWLRDAIAFAGEPE
jgi:preprotein translocase subunit SecA